MPVSPVPADYHLPSQPMPILVQLGLTYRCNLKCDHCYALYRRDLNEFTYDEVQDITGQLWDLGGSAVVYSHGENLIRHDFHQIALAIYEKGFYQTLMTNGFYLRSRSDAERLKATGVNRVLVSLDSTDSATHDRQRGIEGAFDVALKAVDLLKEAEIPAVGFSTTLDVHNYGEIELIVDLARHHQLDAISFMQNRYNRPGVFTRSLWLQYVDICRRLYELILDNQNVIDIYTHDPFMLTLLDDRLSDPRRREDFIGSNICNVGTNMISIDPVGNVTGCNFIEESIGNVRTESVETIWRRLVERYSDINKPPSGPCSGCSQLSTCLGGCKAFHYNGKYDERCGQTRFGDSAPHGLEPRSLPLYPTAPLNRKAGVYQRERGIS